MEGKGEGEGIDRRREKRLQCIIIMAHKYVFVAYKEVRYFQIF